MKTAISATITHDLETWTARLGQRLDGRDRRGRPLRSRAVVTRIDPATETIYSTGDSNWNAEAQVHGMSDVVWADVEHEDVTSADRDSVLASRAEAGWSLYDEAELVDDPERKRLIFSRPWVEPGE